MEVVCALCHKKFDIKKYRVKERNFCCREHYHQFARKIYEKSDTIKCDYCGKKFVYKDGKSHLGRSDKHYCSIECLCKHNRKYQEPHTKANKRYTIWCHAKKRAKQKDFEFNLELDDIPEIPEFCPVLGIKITPNNTNAPLDSSPSLDRIDSTKGYIKGNVRIISNRANRIKADATIEELRKVLEDYEKILRENR